MGVLLFLTSCQKTSQKRPVNASNSLFLVQAKLVDLPVPIGFTLVENKSGIRDDNRIIFHYRGDLSVQKTITFYQNEMEVNGWSIQDFSTEKEGLLFCRKVNKSCALSIRPKTIRIVLDQQRRIAKKSTDDLINDKKIIQL